MDGVWSVLTGHKDIDVNVRDRDGKTAVMLAYDEYKAWSMGAKMSGHKMNRNQTIFNGEDIPLPDYVLVSMLEDTRHDLTLQDSSGHTLLDQALTAVHTATPDAGHWLHSVIAAIGNHPSATEAMREQAAKAVREWERKVKRVLVTKTLVKQCDWPGGGRTEQLPQTVNVH